MNPITCSNYEVVFSGDEVLLTFDANDVPFLKTLAHEEASGIPPQAGADGIQLHGNSAEAQGEDGSAPDGAITVSFGALGQVRFPDLPVPVENAIRTVGALWIVGLDSDGAVLSEARLPL